MKQFLNTKLQRILFHAHPELTVKEIEAGTTKLSQNNKEKMSKRAGITILLLSTNYINFPTSQLKVGMRIIKKKDNYFFLQ